MNFAIILFLVSASLFLLMKGAEVWHHMIHNPKPKDRNEDAD